MCISVSWETDFVPFFFFSEGHFNLLAFKSTFGILALIGVYSEVIWSMGD